MSDEIRRWSDELARDPASLAFLRLGEALRRSGDTDVALKLALRGVERHPERVDAHDLVARIALDRDDIARAAEAWKTVLRSVPDHADALKGLAFISFKEGRLEDAERLLRRAAECGGGDSVAAALATVRRSSQGVVAPEDAPADTPDMPHVSDVPDPSETPDASVMTDPRWMFADVLTGEAQTALLLDRHGYVLGGLYLDAGGTDLAQEIGAQLSGISDEVVRATRHLAIGEWRSIVFETEAAVVAMAPAAHASLLVVAASRATPLGLMRRLLDRCAARCESWFPEGAA
jgi:tetratricopeptide (TPR) repeat protein